MTRRRRCAGTLITADRSSSTRTTTGRQAETRPPPDDPAAGRRPPGPARRPGRDRAGRRGRGAPSYAEPLIAAVEPGDADGATDVRSVDAARTNSTVSERSSTRRTNTSTRRAAAGIAELDADARTWRDAVLVAMLVGVLRHGGRCWRSLMRRAVTRPLDGAGRACRRITRATSANASSRAGPRTSAPSPPTSRTCGSGSWTNSRRRGRQRRRSAARRADRRVAALQRRTRAVRLRGIPRPAGTAAQGRVVLPAAREALRRQTRRARRRVHRLRRRRRQAHAGADQRPAHLLPGRPAQRHRDRGRPRQRAGRRAGQPRRPPIEESGAEIVRPGSRCRTIDRRPDAAGDAVAEPDRQRGEVPPRRTSRRGSSSSASPDRRRRLCTGCSRCRTTGSGSPPEFVDKVFVIFQRLHGRDAYTRHGHRAGAVQEDRRIPRRRHLDRHVLHRRNPVPLHPARRRDRRHSERLRPSWKDQHA